MIRALSDSINWIEAQSPEKLESNAPKLPVIYKEEMNLTDAQAKLLEKWIKIFEQHYDIKFNIQQLKEIYNLISNPSTKIQLVGGIEKLSLFNIVESTLTLVKNIGNRTDNNKLNLPRFRTVFTNKSHKQNLEIDRLSIDFQDLQKIRINFAKREKTGFYKKKDSKSKINKGRIIRYTSEQIENSKVMIVPTILNSIQSGDYSLSEKRFNIKSRNFLFPQYEQNVIYNIMLVLDTSKSISWFIPHVEKLISYIISNVTNSKDKLGLITFNNDVAQIYHYPTLNVKQVIGTINKLEIKGQTPLGQGLNLALKIFSNDKYKQHGMKNLIILISDCFPEPIEGGHKNLLNEPSYKLVLSAVEHIKQSGAGLIIINPSAQKGNSKNNWGIRLGEKCAEITAGKYIEVHSEKKYNLFTGEKIDINEQTLSDFFTAVSEIKNEI